MTRLNFYLDSRSRLGDCPLKIRVYKKGETAYVDLDVRLQPDQWDASLGRIINHPLKSRLNRRINELLYDAIDAVEAYEDKHRGEHIEVADLKKVITGEADVEALFEARFLDFMSRKTGRTRELYEATLKKMRVFDERLKYKEFGHIDRRWLIKFDTFLSVSSPSANARAIHFRNIRAVFNDALDDEITTAYPFRRFKIKKEATIKRSLTAEQLRAFFDAPVADYEKKYLDMFKLSFLLIGINTVDLCRLKSISGDRIDYIRAKTHQPYSIKVEPEAREIIEQYRGKDWLLDMGDRFADYRSFTYKANKFLHEIGGTHFKGRGQKKILSPMFPNITMYWARHSWATIAASLDIPKETISHALGHKSAYSSVTDVYIDFDMRKVDEANRRVIDYVLYNKV